MLNALVQGIHDPMELARLGDRRLHANKEQLADALSGRFTRAQGMVLKLYLQQINQIEQQIADLDQALASALTQHLDAIERLC